MAASQPPARATPRGVGIEWFAQHPAWLLAVATLLVLLPFAGKPFSIDDPLFIWVARHIQSHPFNPYGFNANWYGYDWPFWDIMKNPPLTGYYLAAAGSVFGWSEIALHMACWLPALAVVLGTYRLATRLCQRPLLAGFLTLFAPVFLVSSTMLMCDVPMLAFWIWALVFWVEGTEHKRPGYLAAGALLMGLSALTKYFGASLVPLAVVWSVAQKRPIKEWLGWLALPVAMLVAYQVATRALYGHGLLTNASETAVTLRGSSTLLNIKSVLTSLAFTGGCLATAAFFAPIIWPRRELLIGAIASFIVTGILFVAVRNLFPTAPGAGEILQILLWASGGISLLALAAADVYRRRDADSLLLACWVLGTFIFTAFFNWNVNARSILPMTIPAAILVARRLEQRAGAGVKFSRMALFVPAAAGAALAVWLAVADYFLAVESQVAAEVVHSAYGGKGHRLWFQGHWGFQYYMEKNGATALDLQHLKLTEGDYIAMPSGNSNVYPLKEPVTELDTFSVAPFGGLTIMDRQTGAGFHASVWGPLPFAFGPGTAQSVTVFAYDPKGEVQKAAAQKAR
jgi:4-amino-4-deoxy-L-arabinose transferase-like glycosyltransferase